MLEGLKRVLWTVRYLTIAQIRHRAVRRLKLKWWWLTGAVPATPAMVPETRPLFLFQGLSDLPRCSCNWASEIAQAEMAAQQLERFTFEFLGKGHTFSRGINWNDPQLSHLWRYHLHYFNYLLPLCTLRPLASGSAPYAVFKRLVSSWMDSNTRLQGDGWHPYTLSLRIVNWIHAAEAFKQDLTEDPSFKSKYLSSLYYQIRNLFENLEFDVRGNHLLENLRALIWGGCYFEGAEADRWYRSGLHWLEIEVAEQVLPDGGHFERTPGYHLVILKDLIEIALCLRMAKGLVPDWLTNAISRMLSFIDITFGPSFDIPLLKDTALDPAPSVADVSSAGALLLNNENFKFSKSITFYAFLLFGEKGAKQLNEWKESIRTPKNAFCRDSGYMTIASEEHNDCLLLDVGQPCPDYLPAHAHADMLNFELWMGGSKWITDSGVYEYTAGGWRDYFRSTRAHNTVEVDLTNQSDVYGSFRVGRRARPFGRELTCLPGGMVAAQAAHDGYFSRGRTVHQRVVLSVPDAYWVICDLIKGESRREVRSFLHLHPETSITRLGERCFKLEKPSESIFLVVSGGAHIDIVEGVGEPRLQGWCSSRFGELKPNRTFEFRAEGSLPMQFSFALSKRAPVSIRSLDSVGNRLKFEIHHENQHVSGDLALNA
jgi:uncharacterized heparinase superfamily protein